MSAIRRISVRGAVRGGSGERVGIVRVLERRLVGSRHTFISLISEIGEWLPSADCTRSASDQKAEVRSRNVAAERPSGGESRPASRPA